MTTTNPPQLLEAYNCRADSAPLRGALMGHVEVRADVMKVLYRLERDEMSSKSADYEVEALIKTYGQTVYEAGMTDGEARQRAVVDNMRQAFQSMADAKLEAPKYIDDASWEWQAREFQRVAKEVLQAGEYDHAYVPGSEGPCQVCGDVHPAEHLKDPVWTEEVRKRCRENCGEFGDPPCYALPGLSSDAPKNPKPCLQCQRGPIEGHHESLAAQPTDTGGGK